MADETQTTGTPTQDGGDAAQQPTAGTPETDGRNAADDERWKEALVWKEKAERYNDTQRELDQLKASRDQAPRASTPAGDEDYQRRSYETYVSGIAAQAQDENARLWALQEQRRLQNERRIEAENQQMQQIVGYVLRALPEEQQAPFKELQAHPEKYASLDDAQREINLRRKEAEIAKLNAEVKRLQNQNAVPTAGRETQSVPELKKEMTGSEWRKRQAGLTQDQQYAEQKKLRQGEIKVNW